jgi:hypothetical protein
MDVCDEKISRNIFYNRAASWAWVGVVPNSSGCNNRIYRFWRKDNSKLFGQKRLGWQLIAAE